MKIYQRNFNKILICFLGLVLSAAAPKICRPEPSAAKKPVYEAVGLASYYGRRFHGRKTANGERFDMHAMTAAHRGLKFGSRVVVTNLKNGRKVEVRINDRGPYIKGRIIDLSYAAAKKLGMLSQGVAKVKISAIP